MEKPRVRFTITMAYTNKSSRHVLTIEEVRCLLPLEAERDFKLYCTRPIPIVRLIGRALHRFTDRRETDPLTDNFGWT